MFVENHDDNVFFSVTVHSDLDEPGSIALAIGRHQYILKQFKHLFPKVIFSKRLESIQISGPKREVQEAVECVRFFMSSPRKSNGTLFVIAPDKHHQINAIRQKVAELADKPMSHLRFYKDEDTQDGFILVKGLPWQQNHYAITSYLSNL